MKKSRELIGKGTKKLCFSYVLPKNILIFGAIKSRREEANFMTHHNNYSASNFIPS
jgi:hypothetical protein